ncbi:MAG: FMN-binding glutamate synthase family protein [Halobacteriovoraceae bacterium]|nr:FMN-binding glutamate synthase family protein [Halobacteriovoraceae bacterium]
MRKQFFIGSTITIAVLITLYYLLPPIYHPLHFTVSFIFVSIILLGVKDSLQTKQTIKRNFPVLGNFRYWLESIRPEIQQYFVENNIDGRPFNREQRSVIYQRAKKNLDTLPFGTQKDQYKAGHEWVNHSLLAKHIDSSSLRVMIGGPHCKIPYNSSILNISAMSYGALSDRAIMALNAGAKEGGFAHNTGEGSISPHHLKYGGDLIWQIGTGLFGCRNQDGNFDEVLFKEKATLPQVKMIEIKLSQGAKPGHGGILPKEKITDEIAQIRGVGKDKDIISPPGHSSFNTPLEMMSFIAKLRELCGGKPIGIKLCLGKKREFLSICKAMKESGTAPDYIVIDGSEGGTGAAPLEFSNHVGTPGIDGLVFAHNCLTGLGLRKNIKLISSGKILTSFDIIKRLSLGADLVYSARGMMLAIGCIQALRCNSNHCPAGIATQDKNLTSGLVVSDKKDRVKNFHAETIESVAELIGAMGISNTKELRPWHILSRTNSVESKDYSQLFEYLKENQLIEGPIPESYKEALEHSRADSFSRESPRDF